MTTIPKVEHLLPDNATPLERALSASDHRMLSVPVRRDGHAGTGTAEADFDQDDDHDPTGWGTP